MIWSKGDRESEENSAPGLICRRDVWDVAPHVEECTSILLVASVVALLDGRILEMTDVAAWPVNAVCSDYAGW